METYSKYKDSGVEWLGDIPESWEVKSVKSLLEERKEKNDPLKTKNILSLCMYRGVIPYAEKGASGNKAKEDLTAYKLAYPGDIVLNSMNVIAGSVGLSKYFGAVSPVYYMLKPRKKEDKVEYFNSIFRNIAFQKSLIGLGNGILIKKSETTGKLNTIRMRIPMSKLNQVEIPYPSTKEQNAIINFLDKKTAQIEQAISLKQKQITLLKERKQIIIQNAVTKGINPNVKMKDSGIDWIGEIPEEWAVKKLKYVLKVNNGSDYKNIQTDDGYPVIGSGGKFAYASDFMYDGEVVFLGRKGTIDKPLYYKGKFWAVDTMFYAVCNKNAYTKFIFYIAKTIPYLYYSTSTALPSMTQSDINNHYFYLPNIEEQKIIVNHIDYESSKINKAITLQEQQIEKLKEYKETLINSAVTGKIKVN